MSHGNLEGKVVTRDFWPACENCRFGAACKVQPQHPAYPHTWHWGKECAAFADGYLIVRSWVGSSAIGHPPTGCTGYAVDPTYAADPLPPHRRYLALARQRQDLDAQLARLEQADALSPETARLYERLCQRFREITAEQRALRRGEAATPAAA